MRYIILLGLVLGLAGCASVPGCKRFGCCHLGPDHPDYRAESCAAAAGAGPVELGTEERAIAEMAK